MSLNEGISALCDFSAEVIELRRYRLHPGMREMLIDLFDREFVETQEAEGMRVIGQFRDLDDPDSFVWFRGFRSMETRKAALEGFYTGPVWAKHRDIANGTMINSDNVLLLRPSAPGRGFARSVQARQPMGAREAGGLVTITTCSLAPRTENDFAHFFEARVRPLLERTGSRIIASFVTERRPNSFPRLPVREGETVFVWVSGFSDLEAHERHIASLSGLDKWKSAVFPELNGRIWRPLEIARLTPTARSLILG